MGSLVMKATERDPDFLANFERVVGKNKRKTSEAGGWLHACLGAHMGGRQGRDAIPHPSCSRDAAAHLPALPPHPCAAVIVACAVGGTLDTVVRVASTGKQASDPDRSFGRETRSLKACYELMTAGYTNVVHLQGGLSTWRYRGYPTEGTGVGN